MHSIGILAGGAACADLLAQALPPGLWERCRPACAGVCMTCWSWPRTGRSRALCPPG